MKKMALSFVKCITFFVGWAVAASLLPLPPTEDPAIWRLWAELIPLLSVIAFTLLFWLIEKRSISLNLVKAPAKGFLTGAAAGSCWLAAPVLILYAAHSIRFEGVNTVENFPVWVLAALLNVFMQELLVRGYLYQLLKQRHNLAAAVIVTTALFTLMHGGAFEAGPLPVLNVLTMSLLMTVVLEYTGSIIAPTVMHFIWNGVGALVLGGVSLADDYPHLLNMAVLGGPLLSGGTYRIEGSLIVLITNAALIGSFLLLCRRRRRVRQALQSKG